MRTRSPQRSALVGEYDEVAYREALRALGLFAPVKLDDLQTAYRRRAKIFHPDRAAINGNAEDATRQMERLNAAHKYAVRHFQRFDRTRNRALRLASAGEKPVSAWLQILFLPVTSVYSLALLAAAGPAAALSPPESVEVPPAPSRRQRLERWLREKWLLLGPHALVIAAFLGVEAWANAPAILKWWLGLSLLIMLASDVASGVTGEKNPLREHPAVERLQAYVRG